VSVTSLRVWRLALPNILANLTIPLLGAVDTAVIGHLGAAEIGAVAVGSTVFSFLYWGFGFLRMGTTGVVAQAHGAGDGEAVVAAFLRGAVLAVTFGLALVALQWPLIHGALAIIAPSETVTAEASRYLTIRIWGGPAALLNMVVLGWLIARQRMGTGLWLQLLINGSNIVLDVALARGLGMDVAGVAVATVIAQWLGAGAGIAVILRQGKRLAPAWPWATALDRAQLAALLRLNVDILVRTLLVITSFSMMTVLGARFGDEVLAANGILLLLQGFLSYGLDGFAHAAEALVGEAVGARDRKALTAAVRGTTVAAAGVAAGYTVAFWLGGPALVGLITSVPEVRATTALYLPWTIASPLISVWSYQLDGIFIGATHGRAMRNAMIASVTLYVVALLLLVPAHGNAGLWTAFLFLMAARGVTLAVAYPRLARGVSAC
jgi:multidrug resistance protein, MATE family